MTTSTRNPQLFKMSVSRFVTADTHLELVGYASDGIPTVKATLPGSSDRTMFIEQRARSYTVRAFNGAEEVLHKEFVGEACFDDLAKFLSFVN